MSIKKSINSILLSAKKFNYQYNKVYKELNSNSLYEVNKKRDTWS